MLIARAFARFLLALAFLVVLLAYMGFKASEIAHADHNGPWLPSPSYYGVTKTVDDYTNWPSQARARDRGEVHYCFDSVAAAYPGFRDQASQVAQYAASRTTIPAREVPYDASAGGNCDEILTMPDDATFVAKCGAGAAGCIEFWRDPVMIYFRRSLGYSDWRSAQCHEGTDSGHFMGLHEEYNDVAFTSNGRTWTCMDFGTYVWQMPDWDRDRILNCWTPDAPASMSLTVVSGWARVDWSQNRADGGYAHCDGIASPTAPGIAKNTNATVMVFGVASCASCAVTWIGDAGCGAEFSHCTSAYGDGSRWFDAFWHGCIFERAANAATWTVPQISAPNFWSLAGCWS